MATNFRYKHLRGTTEQWSKSTIIPFDGELVIEERTDGTVGIKAGNGNDLFADLPYISKENITKEDLSSELVALIDGKLDADSLNGYATEDYVDTAESNAIASAKEYTDEKVGSVDVSLQINEHNTSTSAHSDIRALIEDIDEGKVDKVDGKGLSTNDFTDAEKTKLAGIASGAEANVQSDWNATSGDALIKNKPTTLAGYGITDAAPLSHTTASNPHGITKSTVGLGNVTNDAQVKRAEMGVAGGVATLGSDGKVPTSQLPSYVDDVLEYTAKANFPTTGEDGKIYVDETTNKTYRWGGSAYVEISSSLALGTTSSTAYYGDKGKIAYEHSQTAHAPSNAEANVQSDWSVTDTSSDAYIKNKPDVIVEGDSRLTDARTPKSHTHTKSEITDFPTSMTPTAHTHEADEVTKMTGYSKASAASAIEASDTLNAAIGKLEKALDGKQASGSYAILSHTHTKSQITDFPASLPANGGNADTVDGKHASDFATSGHTHTVDGALSSTSTNPVQNKVVNSALTGKADKEAGVFYVVGGGTTDTTNKVATWTGSHDDISAYYDGLMIAYKIGTAASTTTTLNINDLGAVTVVRNANTAVSTVYPVDSIVFLVYTTDGDTAYWKAHEYDANTRNTVGDYRKNSTKLYFVGTASSDASTSSSYATSYTNSNIYVTTDNVLYSALGFSGDLTGNADTATKATQDGSGNTITSTYATKTELSNLFSYSNGTLTINN